MTVRDLRALARSYGVQLSFTDASGVVRRAKADALVAVTKALGAPIDDVGDASEALTELRSSRRRAPAPNGRIWGTFIPLYALVSERSLGIGDFTDLEALLRFTRKVGGSFVGTLPLYAQFLDDPFEPSPYAPVSRLFYNEIYADPVRTPEFESNAEARELVASRAFRAEVERLKTGRHVDLRNVAALKRRLLELLSSTSSSDLGERMRAFEQREPLTKEYAAFRARKEKKAGSDLYHRYVQLVAHEQLESLAAAEADGGLHLDLPLGVHPEGFDIEAFPDAFVQGMSVGAPPDAFFAAGQNWGFPPVHPRRGIPYFRRTLAKLASVATVLRIDHVMGLHRQFYIPDGMPATDGVYVRYPAAELYAIVIDEARKHGTIVVGEDLGTVPNAVRQALRRYGILSTFVAQFRAFDEPSAGDLACLNTHDMEPFATYRRQRPDVGDASSVLRSLASSDAPIVVVNLEDLWGEQEPQNVPGTTHNERPNWTRRARMSLEELTSDANVDAILNEISVRRTEAA